MTAEEIREQRQLDYKTLGRFLGIATMAAEPDFWQFPPEQALKRLVEIGKEYREAIAKMSAEAVRND